MTYNNLHSHCLTVNKWQNFPRAYPHNLIPSPTQWCSSYCVFESSFNGASDSYHNNLRRITSLYSYSHPSVLSYNSPTPSHPTPAKVFPLKDAHWRSRKRTSEDARLYISLESCCKPPTHVSSFSRTCSLSNNPDECVKMVIKYCSQDLITSTPSYEIEFPHSSKSAMNCWKSSLHIWFLRFCVVNSFLESLPGGSHY